MADTLMTTYKRLPVTFARGEGVWLWDAQGTRYLDAVAGIAVCGLGHAHPRIREALCEQAGQLIHTSNLYGIANQGVLTIGASGLNVTGNTAGGDGGGLWSVVSAAMTLTLTAADNMAGGSGGGLYLGNTHCTDCSITRSGISRVIRGRGARSAGVPDRRR